MKKILISLCVPSISMKRDVYIPDFMKIEDVTKLLVQSVEELSDYRYVSSGHEVLCLKEKNWTLPSNLSLKQCDVKNGDCLLLM